MPRISKRDPRAKSSTLCIFDGCTTRASYGHAGQKKNHCAKHKEVGMVNSNKKCICEVPKQVSFALPGGRPSRCAACKTDGMVDVVSRMCACDPPRNANFALPGERATRCSACKTDGMVDVKNKKCVCDPPRQPRFAMPGGRATRCAACKTDGMVDVCNPKCGCDPPKQPTFALPGERATHCARCKTDGMTDVISKKCICTIPRQPTFALLGGKASRCAACKTEDMVDVANPRCIGRDGNGCPFDKYPHYGKHCIYCTTDPKAAKRFKATETRCLKEVFRAMDPSTTATEQFRVAYACTDVERTCSYVDAVLDHPSIRILLEVDECQHAREDESCRVTRMHNVVEELRIQSDDARPIAWVRFNPDDGMEPASARDQLKRCRGAVKAIRELIESPRDGIIFVNYT